MQSRNWGRIGLPQLPGDFMIRTEVSIGYAVKKLRNEIDGGVFNHVFGGFLAACRLFAFIVKFCLVWLMADLADLLFGIRVALVVFFLLMGWLVIPRIWKVSEFSYGVRKKRNGLMMGTAYSRITEQYANVDARPMRGTNVLNTVGRKESYYVDYGSEPNPHVLVVGSSSSGKTSTTKAFICRNYIKYGTHFLMVDWDGDNERWAAECGAALWKVPENFKINMFRLNGANPEQRASMVEDALLIAGRMTMLQATKVKNMVLKAYVAGSEPTLDTIVESLNRDGRKNSLIIYRLSAIWRVVGEEPETFWKSIFENNTVISLSGLNESEKAVVAYFILHRICELFEKEEPYAKEKLLVVVDEAWQLLNSSTRLGIHESLAERVIRVGRRYGFGIMTSTQQLSDVTEPFINSSSLIFLHNYRQLNMNRLALNQFDLAYLSSAGQGECLVFDRLRSQMGQTYTDYVKIRQLDYGEYAQLKAKSVDFEVPSYGEQQRFPELPKTHAESSVSKKSPFKIPEGAPSPAEHAAMLAIYYCNDKTKSSLIRYIKGKGWVRSETTLYGYTARPGILDSIVNAGFAVKSKDAYNLTESGLKWVDPERILINQSDKLGSEEHKRLLIKTIHELHESNILVVTSSIKHSPDLIAWPVHEKKRYLWDIRRVKGYEAQTSARRDSIMQNSDKMIKSKISTIWVSSNEKISDRINDIITNKG